MLWIDAVRDAGGVKIVLQDNGGGIAGRSFRHSSRL